MHLSKAMRVSATTTIFDTIQVFHAPVNLLSTTADSALSTPCLCVLFCFVSFYFVCMGVRANARIEPIKIKTVQLSHM